MYLLNSTAINSVILDRIAPLLLVVIIGSMLFTALSSLKRNYKNSLMAILVCLLLIWIVFRTDTALDVVDQAVTTALNIVKGFDFSATKTN